MNPKFLNEVSSTVSMPAGPQTQLIALSCTMFVLSPCLPAWKYTRRSVWAHVASLTHCIVS